MSPSTGASGLTLVSASAGSGKTYRLSQEVTRTLSSAAEATSPQGLVAVTYTTKAQAELESRLRRHLIEQGHFAKAELLPLAYLGTVHSVCLRLVQEFAIDAGFSPSVDGLPQEAARRLLQEALERATPHDLRAEVDELAGALELRFDPRTKQFDWITPVEQIMTLARNNRISPESLEAMAERSWLGLLAVLGPPLSDAAELEATLAAELTTAIDAIQRLADGQKNTSAVLTELEESLQLLSEGQLLWSKWNKLTALSPGKKALSIVAPVREVAAQYIHHPRLHAQLRAMCQRLFDVARLGLSAYAEWKARRGLVDYIDMIDHALSLLDLPEVAAELKSRLSLLVVDEFQDSSPVQLALFTRLHTLCGRSLWVGDRKQCIFEYAGADPLLMESVHQWVKEQSGKSEVLGSNYRSRPELVDLVSALFSRAFVQHGQRPEEVVTRPAREPLSELAALAPTGVWWVQPRSQLEEIAEGVRRLLAFPEATPVLDRETTQARPLRASDIAILVATNTHAEKLAEHLKARGVHSVLARTGLMTTPEGTLLVAALRFLADRHDSLAAAEIEALLGFSNGDHEAWLSQRIAHHDAATTERKRRTAAQEANVTAPRDTNDTAKAVSNETAEPDANDTATLIDTATPIDTVTRETNETLQALNELRPSLSHLSPMEVVDQVLATLNFPKLARRWPDLEQRLANLDALRALVAAYENRATYLREAASLQGLLRYFEETQEKVKQQDEERASDEQHVLGSTDAVVLSTYHKSKGLEWPVVILADLDREGRRDVFDVLPESDEDGFDATDPLGKRWIRYWPWPLGLSRKAALRDRAESSEVGKRLAQREARERVRLLYVGFTRARDHLVLAVPATKKGELKCAWLDELRDDAGPLLQLPRVGDHEHTLRLRGDGETFDVAARVWSLNTSNEAPKDTTGDVGVFNEVPRSHDLSTNGKDDNARTSNDAGTTDGAEASNPSRLWYTPRATPRVMQRYIITPSEAADAELELATPRILSSERLTHRLPFTSPKGKTWDEVGNALHAFLAADEHHLSEEQRLALAQRILNATGVGDAATLGDSFRPEDLLSASDALRGFVCARWPTAIWHREVPIAALLDTKHGTRAVNGTIDLWLETEAGGIVIDHKSFPGAASSWNEQALKHAPQLFTYGLALRAAGKRVLGYFLHFVVGGGMVEVGE